MPPLLLLKATFPPNISIEKFCQSAKRIIGVTLAAVVRDVFATTTSFKRCTVLHNAFPVCTTVYVFQANSARTLALAPSRPLQNTCAITQYPRGCWIQEGTRYTPRRATTVESENGLRKICFVQKINLESRASFLRSIIVEMFGGNVALRKMWCVVVCISRHKHASKDVWWAFLVCMLQAQYVFLYKAMTMFASLYLKEEQSSGKSDDFNF